MRRFRQLLVVVALIIVAAVGVNRVFQKMTASPSTSQRTTQTTKKTAKAGEPGWQPDGFTEAVDAAVWPSA